MKIEWGSVARGRVWHVLDGEIDGMPRLFCNRAKTAVEVTENQPPIGGLVCERCQADVADLGSAVLMAVVNERPREEADTGGE